MQNTRFNGLVDVVVNQLGQLFQNPWRRLSLLIISLLFGIFLGSVISTTTGQAATWDVLAAAVLVILTEVISRIAYHNQAAKRSLWTEVANDIKIGLIYGMFVEAFKIGS